MFRLVNFLAPKCLIWPQHAPRTCITMCASGIKKHPDINGENKLKYVEIRVYCTLSKWLVEIGSDYMSYRRRCPSIFFGIWRGHNPNLLVPWVDITPSFWWSHPRVVGALRWPGRVCGYLMDGPSGFYAWLDGLPSYRLQRGVHPGGETSFVCVCVW